MAAVEERAAVDGDKLMGFVFRAVDEIGARSEEHTSELQSP